MRQETGPWLRHRALWDWKSALGLAEERDSGDRGRKYEVSPYSEGSAETLEGWFLRLPVICQPRLDSLQNLGLTALSVFNQGGERSEKACGYCLFSKSI